MFQIAGGIILAGILVSVFGASIEIGAMIYAAKQEHDKRNAK